VKLLLYALWAAGLALLIGLLAYHGIDDIAAAIGAAGFGLAGVIAYRALPMLVDTIGWQVLLPRSQPRSLAALFRMRWIGDAINLLLPVAQVGGELVRAKLLGRTGVAGPLAGASVVVDLTAAVLTQVAFALLGAALLAQRSDSSDAALAIGVGIGMFSLLLAGFYLAQRAGMFETLARALERVARGGDWISLVGSATLLDQSVKRLYRRKAPFLSACTWHFVFWLLCIGESWLALHALGHPATLLEALVIESLGSAVRAAAFAVPGALGVQEGAFILLGSLLGIDAQIALALSLVKRVRELAWGLPALATWQISEWRRTLHLAGRDTRPPPQASKP
jgi:putative membrane protein